MGPAIGIEPERPASGDQTREDAMGLTVSLTVNGQKVSQQVEERTLLVELLRQHLRLTGTHVGCDTSQCGACVVHLDGRSVKRRNGGGGSGRAGGARKPELVGVDRRRPGRGAAPHLRSLNTWASRADFDA